MMHFHYVVMFQIRGWNHELVKVWASRRNSTFAGICGWLSFIWLLHPAGENGRLLLWWQMGGNFNTICLDVFVFFVVVPSYHGIYGYLFRDIFFLGSLYWKIRTSRAKSQISKFPKLYQLYPCMIFDSVWCSFGCRLPTLWNAGIPVDMGECVNASQAQSWECLGRQISFQLEVPLGWLWFM